jgi:GDP-L-fucose synthase
MSKRIFVAGHQGMVGSAIGRQLSKVPNTELVTRSRAELDLSIQQDVAEFFASEKIDEVYLGAAKVGGIHANDTYPAEFIYDNLMVECNVVHQAWKNGVQKLLFLGSSCITGCLPLAGRMNR